MNDDTSKNKQTQFLSFDCPEEKVAALITEAKVGFDDFFASLKVSLVASDSGHVDASNIYIDVERALKEA
ncbi:MAG: hypothetical protein K1000chlam3_00690 [Chlamydiae bacterium]|nr:hypothetical protein [Chlamydiota bacterium]